MEKVAWTVVKFDECRDATHPEGIPNGLRFSRYQIEKQVSIAARHPPSLII